MSCQNELVKMLRYIIDDVDCSAYTDDRLEETIIVSAQFVNLEIDFDKTYTIDVDQLILTPDPTDAVKDDAFINLVVLKAGCIVLTGEAKAKALEALKMKDGPVEIDTSHRHRALETQAKQMCEAYQKTKLQYVTGTGRTGQAVMTPFTFERFGYDINRGFN